jgi:formylglycine-generating enzyme required for sulfatase activity
MVMLPEGYCIDSTEVSRGQYQAWLDTNPSTDGQISDCTWNTTFVPDGSCMSQPDVCQGAEGTECDNHPQVCVDWCDAYAYCVGVGKRLCGRIGGGPNGLDHYATATLSQWYNVCVSGGANNTYPYGNTYQSSYCNGAEHGVGTTVPVGSMIACQSSALSYSGVYDLSGNVQEWEDSCDGAGEFALCNLRGGSVHHSDYDLTCAIGVAISRNYAGHYTGFRCCS